MPDQSRQIRRWLMRTKGGAGVQTPPDAPAQPIPLPITHEDQMPGVPAQVEGVPSGIIIRYYADVKPMPGTGFNFWGMPIEDAITNTLDVLVRLHQLHMQALITGLPGMPMSLTELDEMLRVALEVRAERMRAGLMPGGQPQPVVDDALRAAQVAAVTKNGAHE
jgi:hypothetical protein